MLKVNKEKCTGDGICLEICPVEAAVFNEEEKAYIDPDICIECYSCINICPEEAIYEDEE